MKKICIIEDDTGIADSLKLYLENSDFEVCLFGSWEGADDFIVQEDPSLVILDINLPGKNGIEICEDLRKTSQIPVIMLTARGGEMDKISGLESGADDYIAKPFSPRELLARVQTILRRMGESSETNTLMRYENISLDQDRAEVFLEKNPVTLTKNEYDLLLTIWLAGGKLVTREYLMKEVMGYDNYVYDRTIDTHIKNLRKKLQNQDMILTVRGKWYRLNS